MSKLDSYLYVVPHPLLPQTVLTVVTLQREDRREREREATKETLVYGRESREVEREGTSE